MIVRHWHMLHRRLRSLLFRTRREADLCEELQFHLEREAEPLEAAGMRPDAARLHALRTFGGVDPATEAGRDARGTMLVDSVACAGAALIPALRAGRIDPVAALRQD